MNTLISLIFASAASAALSGNQKITTHHYNQIQGALDTNPVFCGYPGSQMDISRITAVQGLTQSQCGACLKVCNADDPSKHQYVMAVDRGGVGLDLNVDSFYALFGDRTGLYGATWEQVDSSNCAGILQNGNQYKANPAPATTVSPPVVPATTEYAVKTTTTTVPYYAEKATTTTTTTPAYVEKTTTTTTTPAYVEKTTTTTTTSAYPVQTTTTTTDAYPVNTTTTTTTTNAYPVNTTTTTNAYPVNTTTTTDAYPVNPTTTTTTTTTTSPATYPTVNPQKIKCHRRVASNN